MANAYINDNADSGRTPNSQTGKYNYNKSYNVISNRDYREYIANYKPELKVIKDTIDLDNVDFKKYNFTDDHIFAFKLYAKILNNVNSEFKVMYTIDNDWNITQTNYKLLYDQVKSSSIYNEYKGTEKYKLEDIIKYIVNEYAIYYNILHIKSSALIKCKNNGIMEVNNLSIDKAFEFDIINAIRSNMSVFISSIQAVRDIPYYNNDKYQLINHLIRIQMFERIKQNKLNLYEDNTTSSEESNNE